MRVAIVSDIHGNIRGLDACLDDLAAQGGADHLVAAGDLCMDGPKPRKVLERLQEAGAQCVRGNTDRMIAQGVDDLEEGRAIAWQRDRIGRTWTKWLGELPLQLRLGDELNTLLIAHANPKNDDEHVWPDAGEAQLERLFGDVHAAAIAFGHLHLPYVRTWRGKLLVNVASAGLPKDGDPRAHYAILTNRDGGWEVKSRRVAFDVDKVAKDLRKSEMPDLAERLRVLRRHRYKNLTSIIP
ncbi:MAG: metallophosphoesterase family protein [Candidatus Velthaea sp.]